MRVGLAPRLERNSARLREILERAPRPLLAEIARHGRDQLLDRDRGLPEPEGWRDGHGSTVRADENARLQSLDRRRRCQERDGDEGDDIEAETPEYAVGEGSSIKSEKRLRFQSFDAEQTEIEDRAIQQTRGDEAREK